MGKLNNLDRQLKEIVKRQNETEDQLNNISGVSLSSLQFNEIDTVF